MAVNHYLLTRCSKSINQFRVELLSFYKRQPSWRRWGKDFMNFVFLHDSISTLFSPAIM